MNKLFFLKLKKMLDKHVFIVYNDYRKKRKGKQTMNAYYTKAAADLLNHYNWTPTEARIIKTRLQEVLEKFWAMDEDTEAKLVEAFNLWLDGAPKKRLTYWMKKTNTTVEELNIYMTY